MTIEKNRKQTFDNLVRGLGIDAGKQQYTQKMMGIESGRTTGKPNDLHFCCVGSSIL